MHINIGHCFYASMILISHDTTGISVVEASLDPAVGWTPSPGSRPGGGTQPTNCSRLDDRTAWMNQKNPENFVEVDQKMTMDQYL